MKKIVVFDEFIISATGRDIKSITAVLTEKYQQEILEVWWLLMQKHKAEERLQYNNMVVLGCPEGQPFYHLLQICDLSLHEQVF